MVGIRGVGFKKNIVRHAVAVFECAATTGKEPVRPGMGTYDLWVR